MCQFVFFYKMFSCFNIENERQNENKYSTKQLIQTYATICWRGAKENKYSNAAKLYWIPVIVNSQSNLCTKEESSRPVCFYSESVRPLVNLAQ